MTALAVKAVEELNKTLIKMKSWCEYYNELKANGEYPDKLKGAATEIWKVYRENIHYKCSFQLVKECPEVARLGTDIDFLYYKTLEDYCKDVKLSSM